jgi:hypothetical protein
MKRHLCVELRLSALSTANLTSNGLIERFGPSYKTSNPSMLREKLYFDLKRQTPFQFIFEGKIAIFLFVSGLYLQYYLWA